MQSVPQAAPASKKMLWADRIMSILVILFLTFDATIKLMRIPPALEGTARLGYPLSIVLPLGIVLLTCVVLYVMPSTSFLGAILLTGYLGGAVASNVRVGNPLFGYVLAPIYVAVLMWGGLYLRDDRLRALVPLRSPN